MRILHLTRDFPPQHSGGLSTAVAGMVEAQVAAGLTCTVLSFDNYRPRSSVVARELSARASVASGKCSLIRVQEETNIDSALELASLCDADVVHVHHGGLWTFAQPLATTLRAKTLYSLHVLQSEQDRLRECAPTRSTLAQRRALFAADALHLPSQAVAQIVRESEPRLASKAHVIRLGSAAAASTLPRQTEQAASALPRQTEQAASAAIPALDRGETRSPLVAYVGRFADINGFAQFLQALPTLFAKNPSIRAIAAGGLPGNARGETRWRKRWQDIAGEHAARLSMPGWLPQEGLADVYKRAAVLVVPSWFESFGQVLLEGMVHGTPLVTTGAGALRELVDENSALLIESKSSDAIVAGVQVLLDDPLAAYERARRAQERAHEGYLWSARMPAFLTLYRDLAS